jgi:hypothetical protein
MGAYRAGNMPARYLPSDKYQNNCGLQKNVCRPQFVKASYGFVIGGNVLV